MGVTVTEVRDGVLTIVLSGTLTQSALAAAQKTAADIIRSQGNVRVLVRAEQFAGWERGAAWDDFSFQDEFDRSIEKMAIVGDTRWEDLALVFTAKGLRPFPIEYFATNDLERAHVWLTSSP